MVEGIHLQVDYTESWHFVLVYVLTLAINMGVQVLSDRHCLGT